MNKNLRQVFSYFGKHRMLLAGLIGTSLVETSAFLAMPFCIRYFMDEGLTKGKESMMWLTLLAYIGVILIILGGQFLLQYLQKLLHEKVVGDVRLQLVDKYLKTDIMDTLGKGDLLTAFEDDCQGLAGNIPAALSTIVTSCLRLVIGLVVLWSVNYKMLVAVVLLLPLYLLDARVVNKPLSESTNRLQEEKCKTITALDQIIDHKKHLVVHGMTAKTFGGLSSLVRTLAKKSLIADTWTNLSFSIGVAIYFLAMILVYIMGGLQVIRGMMTLGTLVFYIQYIDNIFMPSKQLLLVNADFQRAMVCAGRLTAIEEALPLRPGLGQDGQLLGPAGLEVNDLTYIFDRDHVFKPVSFAMKPGQILGIRGPSGSGKSTLLALIGGLRQSSLGGIVLNQTPLQTLDEQILYDNLGMVFQDPFVFEGSARDNVELHGCLGHPLVEAFSYKLYAELSQGPDTYLSHQGKNLSGGQKQRLALARLFNSDKQVFLLDEPCSGLDKENKLLVKTIIKDMKKMGKIIVMISHDHDFHDLYDQELVIMA